MKIINRRYNIIESLKRDSNGTIFLVEDQMHNNKRLRLKLFHVEFSKNRIIEVIFNDFLKMKSIKHPNLLDVHSFSVVSHVNEKAFNKLQYFYTFEDFDEKICVDYKTLSRNESVKVIMELFKIFRFLSFRGINYTYLNFENLMIFKEGDKIWIKLKDLVNLIQYEEYSTFKSNANIQFLAPEIIWGEERDLTSDIYSLGAMLYFLYYREDYTLKKLESYKNVRNRSEIYDLIKKATNNFKEERYETIQEMFDEVQKIFWVTYELEDYKYYNVLNFKTPLVGHKSLIRDVTKSKNDKLTTFTGVGYLLHGKSGSGKSRILKEFSQLFMYSGDFVNFYYAKEKIEDNQWIERLIVNILSVGDVPASMIQKYGPEILKIIPSYGKVWDMVPSQPLSDEKEKLRLINRLYNFLLEYATLHPFVLMIDDIQFLNPFEFGIINNLVKHSNEAPIYLMLSVDDLKLVESVGWLPSLDIHFEEVSPFNLEETGEYIQSILGMAHVPYGVAIPVMDEASGNARVVEEIIRNFYLEGRLTVSDKPTWQLDKEKPIAEIEIKYNEGVANSQLVANLSQAVRDILIKVSVFKENFTQILYNDFIEDESHEVLNDLVRLNLINRKLTDDEYVFSFASKNIKRYFYQKLSKDQQKDLHYKLADLISTYFEVEKSYREELVYHLIQSEQYGKAAQCYRLIADHYIELHRYKDAIEQLKEASRYGDLVGLQEENGDALFTMGTLYLMFSMLEEALFVFKKAQSRYRERENQLNCDIKIGSIQIQMNHLEEAQILFEGIRSEALDLSYTEGELEAICYLARIHYYRGHSSTFMDTVMEALNRAKGLQLIYLVGRLQSEMAIYEIVNERYEEALEYFNRALTNYEIDNKILDIIKTLNNIGVLYFNAYSNLGKAREYFERSIEQLKVQNLSDGMSTYLYNVGETYMHEERYEDAVQYMNQALKFSEDSGDKNVLYPIVNGVALINTMTSKFDDASIAINRLEHEYTYFKDRDLDLKDYYYSQIVFFIKIKHLEMAEKWRKLYSDAIGDFSEYRFAIIDFKINFMKKNLFKFSKDIDFDRIEELKEKAAGYLDRLLLRNMILDMALDLLYSKKFLIIQKLLLIESEVEVDFEMQGVSIKRSIVHGFLEEDRIGYYKDLFNKRSIPEDLRWIIFKLVGDEYFATNDFYNALMHYMMASDIIRRITMTIPEVYREPFIVYDENKIELKNKMTELRLKLMGSHRRSKEPHRGMEVNSLDDYFDMRSINELYDHPKFLNSLYDNYEDKYKLRLEGIGDLVKLFKENGLHNFMLLLQLFEQTTISENGYIYIFDEHDEIVEIIKSSQDAQPPDLVQFIKNIAKGDEGIVVNSLYDDEYLLMDQQKGLIAFPIMAHAKEDHQMIENRKSDGRVYKEKMLGYVYLETRSVFNNFSTAAYEECISLIPMLRVMITNYNLRRVSTVDKLTTVFLRKYIEEMFSSELYKARYDDSNLSVIMCDIDKFKDVNDTYGHRKGDEVLHNIGKTLKTSLRATDMVGRYGGEEFILILPKTTKHDAFEVSEKIRTTIQRSNLLGNDPPVTMSFGVSTYPEDGQNEEELIEKADKSLYYSKNSGRNRTTLWNKDLLMKNERFDKLAGILTGNVSGDARNVQAIIDLFGLLKGDDPYESKVLKLLTTILDITESKTASIVLDEKFDSVYTRVRGSGQLTDATFVDKLLLTEYMTKDEGAYFINWDDLSEIDEDVGNPNWNSVILSPLVRNGERQGLLILTVPIHEKEFDFNAFNFVNVLSGVIGSIIEMEEKI